MVTGDSTRWTIIRGAAEGRPVDRAEFARRYASIIRAYLGARWRHSPLRSEIDDAAQEVFVSCFRENGPLTRADPDRRGGFRAYLYGVVRNVARGFEKKRPREQNGSVDLDAFEKDQTPVSHAFDKAWAHSLLRQAGERQTAAARGDERAKFRVEILRRRFQNDEPIREIAERHGKDAPFVHEEYRKARQEFFAALREVVAEHVEGTPAEIEAECARLLDHLN